MLAVLCSCISAGGELSEKGELRVDALCKRIDCSTGRRCACLTGIFRSRRVEMEFHLLSANSWQMLTASSCLLTASSCLLSAASCVSSINSLLCTGFLSLYWLLRPVCLLTAIPVY